MANKQLYEKNEQDGVASYEEFTPVIDLSLVPIGESLAKSAQAASLSVNASTSLQSLLGTLLSNMTTKQSTSGVSYISSQLSWYGAFKTSESPSKRDTPYQGWTQEVTTAKNSLTKTYCDLWRRDLVQYSRSVSGQASPHTYYITSKGKETQSSTEAYTYTYCGSYSEEITGNYTVYIYTLQDTSNENAPVLEEDSSADNYDSEQYVPLGWQFTRPSATVAQAVWGSDRTRTSNGWSAFTTPYIVSKIENVLSDNVFGYGSYTADFSDTSNPKLVLSYTSCKSGYYKLTFRNCYKQNGVLQDLSMSFTTEVLSNGVLTVTFPKRFMRDGSDTGSINPYADSAWNQYKLPSNYSENNIYWIYSTSAVVGIYADSTYKTLLWQDELTRGGSDGYYYKVDEKGLISIQSSEKSISTLTQTASELQTTVSDISSNYSTLSQTASELQTTVKGQNETISTIQQTAKSLSTTVTSITGNILPGANCDTELYISYTNSSDSITLDSEDSSWPMDDPSMNLPYVVLPKYDSNATTQGSSNKNLKFDASGVIQYQTYTFSCYAKKADTSGTAHLNCNLANGRDGYTNQDKNESEGIANSQWSYEITNTWERYAWSREGWAYVNPDVNKRNSYNLKYLVLANLPTTNTDIYIAKAQLQIGSTVTDWKDFDSSTTSALIQTSSELSAQIEGNYNSCLRIQDGKIVAQVSGKDKIAGMSITEEGTTFTGNVEASTFALNTLADTFNPSDNCVLWFTTEKALNAYNSSLGNSSSVTPVMVIRSNGSYYSIKLTEMAVSSSIVQVTGYQTYSTSGFSKVTDLFKKIEGETIQYGTFTKGSFTAFSGTKTYYKASANGRIVYKDTAYCVAAVTCYQQYTVTSTSLASSSKYILMGYKIKGALKDLLANSSSTTTQSTPISIPTSYQSTGYTYDTALSIFSDPQSAAISSLNSTEGDKRYISNLKSKKIYFTASTPSSSPKTVTGLAGMQVILSF